MRNLGSYTREQLETFMIDCHGFERDELAEWETKADLVADICAFGHHDECLAYLS